MENYLEDGEHCSRRENLWEFQVDEIVVNTESVIHGHFRIGVP
jgi:hypothetical protein